MDTQQIVASNSNAKVVHALGTLGTVCGVTSFRKANVVQLATGRRCPTCFTGAPAPATSKKPAAKKAAKPAPAAPAVDTTAQREVSSWTYRITGQQLEATEAKVEKINRRAERRALGGRLTLTVVPVEETETDALTGMEVTVIKFDVTIGGTAPAYNGWQFIATLDWDENAGLMVNAVPGAQQVDRERLRAGWCDHCKTLRGRRVTYVVRDTNNGQQLQVGRSCIKDFTGWTGTVSFLETPNADNEGEWFGAAGRRDFSPLTVLAYSWAVIKLHGFVPTSQHWNTPTRDLVNIALYPSPKSSDDMEFARSLAPLAKEATVRAQEILDFIKSDDFAGDSDYVLNLKSVVQGGGVTPRYFGLVVSAPQAYYRHQERTLVREKAAKLGEGSQWFGTPAVPGVKSERHELKLTVAGVRYIDGDYGVTTLYTMVEEATGNLFKWFASDDVLGDETGVWYVLKATVKKHDEYQGVKATVLTRCKVVDEQPIETDAK